MAESAVGDNRGRGWPDEGVHRVPDAVDVGDLVGDELDDEEGERDAQHEGIRQHLERIGQLNDAESLKQPRRRDSRVHVEARCERGAEREAQRLEGGHVLIVKRERGEDEREREGYYYSVSGTRTN